MNKYIQTVLANSPVLVFKRIMTFGGEY